MIKDGKRKQIICYILVVLVPLILRVGYLCLNGIVKSPDSYSYIRMANNIIAQGPVYYIHNLDAPYYWGYPTYLAIMFFLIGDNFFVICLVQTVLACASMIFLFKALNRLIREQWVCLCMVFLYTIIFDVMMWDRYVLTECLGMTIEAICFYFFINLITADEISKKDFILFAVFCILFFLARSNAITIVFAMGIVIVSRLDRKVRNKILLGFIVVMCGLVSMIIASSIMHPDNVNLIDTIEVATKGIREGNVIDERHEYDILLPSEGFRLPFYALVILKRMVMYWSIFIRAYSKAHKLMCIVGILPTYVLAFLSTFRAFKEKIRTYIELFVVIVLSSLIQIVVFIDYDFRYRAPIFIPLILLGSLSGKYIGDMILKKLKELKLSNDN